MSVSPGSVSGHRLGLLYIMVSIPIHSGQTSNELRFSSVHFSSVAQSCPLNSTQH